jgi:hypothetical protein
MRAKCQPAIKAAAHSSIFRKKNRPSEPRMSSCMQLILPIAHVIDLRRKSQTVNAWKPERPSCADRKEGQGGGSGGLTCIH